uniref:MGDG2 n=1 Tax=Arundo donax TaxID=35708 RepID=A0A0A9G2W3_ARUDO
MSFTMSNTASGCASFSALREYLLNSSTSVLSHRATCLAASLGSLENTPAPLSTT